ncbi:MAG: nucleotidyltransferase family protein [Candidatus Nanohaloarchaea archaeon]
MDKTSHRQAFEEFASEVSQLETVEEVILFGSVARGEHSPRSDVDALVKVTELSQRGRIESIALDTTSRTGIPVTPVVTEDKDTSFMRTVEKEGERYVRG